MNETSLLIPTIPEKFKPYIKQSRRHPYQPHFDWQICMEFPNDYAASIVTGEYATGNIEIYPLKITKVKGSTRAIGCGKEFKLADNSSTVALKDEKQLEQWLEKIFIHSKK